MTIYTAIFGEYDRLKEPTFITPGWKYICFTDQPIDQAKTKWVVIRVPVETDPRLSARDIKINFSKWIFDQYSIWIDGSFQINCNLQKWWADRFRGPMTVIRHPLRSCIYLEAIEASARGGSENLLKQICHYASLQMPPNKGIIQSGILMRERSPEVISFHKVWWNQIEKFSLRDQISFAWVEHCRPDFEINKCTWDYRAGREFIYKKHIQYEKSH